MKGEEKGKRGKKRKKTRNQVWGSKNEYDGKKEKKKEN